MTSEARPIAGEEIVRVLGVGLAFVTFVARGENGALSVCKRVRLVAMAGDDAKKQLAREAQALRAIGGRGAPKLVSAGEDEYGPWVSTELVEGEPLSRGIASMKDVARAAFTALALVHDSGIVHGDVSPSNVIVGEAAWLVDFCTAQGWGLPPLETHEFTGTIGFAAPEHARGEPIDARADLFSLAASIVSAATGLPARPHGEEPLAAQLVSAGERPLDASFVALAPPPLARCLAFDAAARPKSARAVAEDLW